MSASICCAQSFCSGEGYAGAASPAVHVADVAGKMDLGSGGGRCLHGEEWGARDTVEMIYREKTEGKTACPLPGVYGQISDLEEGDRDEGEEGEGG